MTDNSFPGYLHSPYVKVENPRFQQIVKHGGIPLFCEEGRRFLFTARVRDQYQNEYPDLDLIIEMLKLRAWMKKNPDKLVPIAGIRGLISNWLKRADKDRAFRQRILDAQEVDDAIPKR